MSFTVEVKKELCSEELSRRQEKILLYGFCYCLKNNEFFTESEEVKNFLKNITGNKTETKTVVTAVNRRGRNGFLFDFGSAYSESGEVKSDSRYLDGRDESTGLFLRGAFLACGVVTDPNKSYHLEFSVGGKEKSEELFRIITESGMKIKTSCRKDKYILYSKDSEAIADILTYIGAMISSMEVMNAKIYKGVRNDVNRAVNCETANIEKTLEAGRKQAAAIKIIEDIKGLGFLTEDLRSIAEIRRDNIDLSLSDIGKMLDPPISRSGVYHRIRKITEIAEEITKSETNCKKGDCNNEN